MTLDREANVLLEDIRGQVQFLAEGHGVVVGRLDAVEGRLAHVEEAVEVIKLDTGYMKRAFKERFDQIDARFEQVHARFEQVDARFEQVDARFAQVDARFDKLDARFEKLEARFDRLERRFDDLEESFHEMKGVLTELVSTVKQLAPKKRKKRIS